MSKGDMRLRLILLVLSLLAVISATVGGYLYYSAGQHRRLEGSRKTGKGAPRDIDQEHFFISSGEHEGGPVTGGDGCIFGGLV